MNLDTTENDTALDEDIPVMVFRLAVDRKWIVRPLKVVGNLLEGWYTQARYEFVPEQQLTEIFAGYRVTAGYALRFKKFLEPRIAHWRAELATKRLTALVATTPQIEPPPMQSILATIPPPKSKRKPTRIPTTVDNLAAALRMEAFIAASPLTQTQFAIQAETTDRTLRSFRATGKIRGDIFTRIAREMGLTREELINSK